MITGINESKTLAKHVSCECKCKLDGRKCNSKQKWNIDRCWWKCKKHHIYINYYLATCSCCSKTVPRHIIYETKRFYIYSPFY